MGYPLKTLKYISTIYEDKGVVGVEVGDDVYKGTMLRESNKLSHMCNIFTKGPIQDEICPVKPARAERILAGLRHSLPKYNNFPLKFVSK